MDEHQTHTGGDFDSQSRSTENRTFTSDYRCSACGYSMKGLPVTGDCPECGKTGFATPRSRNEPIATELACFNCDYSLRGLTTNDVCPECGVPVLRSLPGDINDVLGTDFACITCGYSLRGLSRADACPECATPVADSLRGDLIFYRSPVYARTLKRGISFVLNGILLQILLAFLAPFMMGLLMAATATAVPGNGFQFIASALQVAASGVVLLGWWWFTSPDPGSTDTDLQSRRIVRFAVIMAAVITILGLIVQMIPFTDPDMRILAGVTFGILGFIAFGLQFFAGLVYARAIAKRLPSLKIAKRAKNRIILCPTLIVLGIAGTGVGALMGPFAFLGALILLCCFLAALILYWNLLNMVRTALKTIIKAQKSGATEPPSITIR